MTLTLKKILLTLIFLTQTMGNAMAGDLSANDKFEIIDVMNNYAKGIDTKNYDLFRSIFDDNVEVNIIYDSSFRSGEPVSFDGIDSWVEYVENAISEYRTTQHMLGNPLIKYENGVAKARTDLQATHYYKDKDNEKTTLWGYYDTHMVNKDGSWKIIKHTLTSIGSN
ncbi:MAG: hypothetical protein CML74_02640 [Rhodobiaceae bacterium]|jgi:hypothetical protein|nr:hypothetical protein [Rhodobiaceae bacterium]|tara:strand:+ start:241 stop:741 length:501 start_codon:yes stop_codon:yes gene_type:complete